MPTTGRAMVATGFPPPSQQGWERVAPTPQSAVPGVTAHAAHSPAPSHHPGHPGFPGACPALSTRFTPHLGTSQPSPRVPGFPLPWPHRPGPSLTQKFSKTNGSPRLWWSPGRRDGFSATLVPAGDLWNKITAGSAHAVGEWGIPQGTAHPFPAGKQEPEAVENTPDAMAGGCE